MPKKIFIVIFFLNFSLQSLSYNDLGDKLHIFEQFYSSFVNIENDYGLTILMYACWLNELDIVRALIGIGADVNVTNSVGFKAADYTRNQEILSLLNSADTK